MPVIERGDDYFAVVTYTGNGSTQTISGLRFQPDFVWIKQRGGATWHNLYDVIRGTTKSLASNDTSAEDTRSTGLTAFTSDGFTLGADNNANGSGNSYVAWCWKANGAGVSNTAGTISSTVSANTTSGFSIATYTGNGTDGATIGHGLGVAPSMVIVKSRSQAFRWMVYFKNLTSDTQTLVLNTTAAVSSLVNPAWSVADTDSQVFGLGNNEDVNGNTYTYVAYCFAPVAGYSAFGSYTGNGSTDGPFVFTGFRPRYVIVKRTDAAYGWTIEDSSRDAYNAVKNMLQANASDAEASSGYEYDFLSNGFKVRNSTVSNNASGGTYIYAAFAENPTKFALAR